MRTMLERCIFLGVVLLSFLCAWRASAKQPVTVNKLFHHTAADMQNIELGSCVLYGSGFTKEPLKQTVRAVAGTEEYSFTIPHATVNDAECRRTMLEINKNNRSRGYRMVMQESKKPGDALTVTFICPKDQCIVSYTYIDSIQREKGIVFHVYNRTLMQSLKKQQAPVIRTAALHAPPRIFIDPGHGGDDTGAVAASGLTEKELCLQVSLRLKAELSELGYAVCMARERDVAVPLDLRTYRAQVCQADVVVSVHANAAPSPKAVGTELFFLDAQSVDEQHNIAADAHALVKKYIHARIDASRELADLIHTALTTTLPDYNVTFKDRGVKKAVSQILVGAGRPAVLIELGFLTNAREAQLLADFQYQSRIAQALAQGIHRYCLNMQV